MTKLNSIDMVGESVNVIEDVASFMVAGGSSHQRNVQQ